jgi:hypothetical protein
MTNTVVTLPPFGSVTVSTKTVNADYQVITLANPQAGTYYFVPGVASTSIPAWLVSQGIEDYVGNVYVFNQQQSAGALTLTAGLFGNYQGFPQVATGLGTIVLGNYSSVTITTVSKGLNYGIINASVPDNVISLPITANATLASLIPVNTLDTVGAIYSFQNTSAAAVTLTTGGFSNYLSYAASTATIFTIQPKQTITFCTDVVGSAYRILSVSAVASVYKIDAAANGTLPALLTTNSIPDVTGNIYTINNTAVVSISITATAYTGFAAYSNQATSTAIGLLPGGSAVVSVNSAGNYQILNVSATGSASTNTFKVSATNAVTIPGGLGPIGFNTVDFDPMSCWNAAQSRWIPKVAGYYQVNVTVGVTGSADVLAAVFKNGVVVLVDNVGNRSGYSCISVSTVVYLNGTTDYLQGAGRCGQASAGIEWTSFSASLQTAQPAVAVSNALARATVSGAQAIINNATTKVTLGTATYNPRGWFDAISNYRFQPNIAGYYQVTGAVAFLSSWATGPAAVYIYKNGSATSGNATAATNQNVICQVTDLIYLNGSSDYLELYVNQTSGATQTINNAGAVTYFDAALMGGLAVATGAVTAPIDNVFKATAPNGGTGPAIGTVATKIILANEKYDPLGAYDVATGVFTPKVAGYYRIIGRLAGAVNSSVTSYIYVNGVVAAVNQASAISTWSGASEVTTNVYLNGTTDYVELYGDTSSSTTIRTTNGGTYCEFSGELIGGVSVNPITTGPQLFKSFYDIALNTFVGLPGDNIQVSWGTNGLYNMYVKTLSGTITPKGFVSYFRGPGGGGLAETMYFGFSGMVSSFTTTSQRINTWGFNASGDNLYWEFVDPATGYNYQIRGMLSPSGLTNFFTIQRNVNNA